MMRNGKRYIMEMGFILVPFLEALTELQSKKLEEDRFLWLRMFEILVQVHSAYCAWAIGGQEHMCKFSTSWC